MTGFPLNIKRSMGKLDKFGAEERRKLALVGDITSRRCSHSRPDARRFGQPGAPVTFPCCTAAGWAEGVIPGRKRSPRQLGLPVLPASYVIGKSANFRDYLESRLKIAPLQKSVS